MADKIHELLPTKMKKKETLLLMHNNIKLEFNYG